MDKGTLKKYLKPALISLVGIGATVTVVCLTKKASKADMSSIFKTFDYKPFEDMTYEAAIELMKSAIEGTTEIIDAQILDDEIAIWFNR